MYYEDYEDMEIEQLDPDSKPIRILHPDDEPNDFVAEPSETFEPVIDQEYAMIFVQRLSKLQESADKLAKRGYYKPYEEDYNAKELFEHRHQLYRRLKDGNAS